MILSKATAYAIRALSYLARRDSGQPCGLRELAESQGIPPVYLSKVLRELRRHRLVHTSKGIHGGYTLARPPSEIPLWEVFQMLDSNPELDDCILGQGVCHPGSACLLHEDWLRIRDSLIHLLQHRTIWDVIAPERLQQPAPSDLKNPAGPECPCEGIPK